MEFVSQYVIPDLLHFGLANLDFKRDIHQTAPITVSFVQRV